MIPEDRRTGNLHPMALLQGVFLVVVLLMLLSLILALLVYFASWQGSPRLFSVLVHLAVVIGSVWAGNRCQRRAWFHGLCVGTAAFLLLTWLGGNQGLFATVLWWKRLLRMAFLGLLGGILGGLLRQ